MNEKRLIDLNDVHYDSNGVTTRGQLEKLPTITLCKNCKYKRKEHDGALYCDYHSLVAVHFYIEENYFCADGKEKDDE